MRALALSIPLLVLVTACSVPPTRLGNDAKNLREAVDDLKSAQVKGEKSETTRQMRRVEKLANDLVSDTFVGDPRRERAEEALAMVRDIRIELEEEKKLAMGTEMDIAKAQAEAILARVEKSKSEVKPIPKDLDMSPLSGIGEEEEDVEVDETKADKDLDRPGRRRRGRGDKEGDVSDNPEDDLPGRKKNEKDDAPKAEFVINEATKPVTILKPIMKQKGLVVYLYFYNRTDNIVRVGSVFGEIKGVRTRTRVLGSFEVDGFKPNFKDILASEGKAITMDGVPVQPKAAVKLAAVAEALDRGKPVEVHLEVTRRDGQVHVGLWKAE